MNTVFVVFIRAIFLYLVFTLPALIVPIMYLYSVFFTACVCWIAGLIFATGFTILKQFSIDLSTKYYTLFLFVILGVWLAFECIELFHLWNYIWRDTTFLLFPLAALVSGCISLFISKQEVIIQLNNQSNELEINSNTSL